MAERAPFRLLVTVDEGALTLADDNGHRLKARVDTAAFDVVTRVELAWLMESDPRLHLGPDRERAKRIRRQVSDLSAQLADVWSSDIPSTGLSSCLPEDLDDLVVVVIGANPVDLDFPWELVPLAGLHHNAMFADAGQLERVLAMNDVKAVPRPESAPRLGPARVLMISPRPAGRFDVPLAPTLGAVLAAAAQTPSSIEVTLLRPPTLTALRDHLLGAPRYDIVHFDGHGMASDVGSFVLFEAEAEAAAPRRVTGTELGRELAGTGAEVVVINACRSAFVDPMGTSVASEVAQEIPGALVVAMAYTVDTKLVSRLVDAIYAGAANPGSVVGAVGMLRQQLCREWAAQDASADELIRRPAFLVPQAIRAGRPGPPMRRPSRFVAATSVVEPHSQDPLDELSLWGEVLFDIDRCARDARDVWVWGVVGSGQDALRQALDRYRRLTHDSSMSTLAATTVHILEQPVAKDVGPVVRLVYPPPQVAGQTGSRLLREDGSDDAVRHVWRVSRVTSEHVGSAELLAEFAALRGLGAALDDLEWGAAELPSIPVTDAVLRLLDALTPSERRAMSVLGLFPGAVIALQPAHLVDALGENVEWLRGLGTTEWTELLERGCVVGLFDHVGVACRVVPAVARVLRSELRGYLGDAATVESLQQAVAESTVTFLSDVASPDYWRLTGVEDLALLSWARRALIDTSVESSAVCGVEWALRHDHDELAARLVRAGVAFSDSNRQSPALMALQMACVNALSPRDDLPPHTELALRDAEAKQARMRYEWPRCLAALDRALALAHLVDSNSGELVEYHTRRADALGRLGRLDEAVDALILAAAVSDGPETEWLIELQARDLAEQRKMSDSAFEIFRARVWRERPDLLGSAPSMGSGRQQLEDERYWMSLLGTAARAGDRAGVAEAKESLGRLRILSGDIAQGLPLLRAALADRVDLGLPATSVLYYLGMAYESADELEAAENWLVEARQSAQSNSELKMLANTSYELGIVYLKADRFEEALETTVIAADGYAALACTQEEADARLLQAQALMHGHFADQDIAGHRRRQARDILVSLANGGERQAEARQILSEMDSADQKSP